MGEAERPKRWSRWLKRAALVLLALLLLALVIHQASNYRFRSALQREIDAIRAAGDPVTLDELWPPEITPESENAALVYQQAFDALQQSGFDQSDASLQEVSAITDPADWSEEATVRVRELPRQYSEPLELIRQAAHMERCRFDPRWGWPPATPTYHYPYLRQAARALCWSAALKLRDGDAASALEEARAAFLTTRALDGDPTLTAFLFKQAVMHMGLKVAEAVLGEGAPTPESCEAFLKDIEEARATLRTHLVDGYKGEQVFALANLAPLAGLDEALPAASRQAAPSQSRSPLAWLGRPFVRSMVLGYLDTVPRIVEIGRADWVEARPLIEALETDASEWQSHPFRNRARVLVAMVVPAWVRLKREETKTEARLAVAQLAFALTLQKAEHGEYPEALDALAPEFLDQIPRDPFTAQPLKYARDGEGFLVYSVGLNGIDDAGLTETEEASEKVNPGTDDIAWRCTR